MVWRVRLVLIAVMIGLTGVAAATSWGQGPRAHAAYARQCSSTDYARHDPRNSLGTPGNAGSDPLTGARLFVETPWFYGGDAADAIADEVGLGYLSHQWSGRPIPWQRFQHRVDTMHLARFTSFRVHLLEKIAGYPQAHQFSRYTAGGSGPAIYTQVQNYVCRMQRTDPGAAAEITTYFLRHSGCNSGWHPRFKAEVDALKAAVGRFTAVIFVEEDALDTMCWSSPSAVHGREALLRYEIDQLSQLPHAVLYVEGGTVDGDSPGNVARALNASDARKARGFFLGDTHFNWAYREIQFGTRVARMTGGLHFVVDSRGDGQGPIRNPHPVTQGNEQLCNPPHRGLGPKPGASNGRAYGMYSRYLDGFVWVTTPGESAASTCPGRAGHWAPSGIFDEGIAIDFAFHANDRIGPSPRFPSRPW